MSLTKRRQWWKNRAHWEKNIVIGIAIALIFHAIDEMPLLRQFENTVMDWAMAMAAANPPEGSAVPLAFLDIDEPSHRNWQEPLHIPRDKLLDIIRYAVAGKPALIVVDVDLGKRGGCPKHDAELDKYLRQYRGPDKPPIILPQFFSEPVEGESGKIPQESLFGKPLPSLGSDARVFWASPLFELDDHDLRLRRWRLWETVGGHRAVPSMELLAVALFNQPQTEPSVVFQELRHQLDTLGPKETVKESGNSGRIAIVGMNLKTETEDITQRIIYSIPGTLSPGEAYPSNFARRSVLPIAHTDPKQESADQCQTPGKSANAGTIDADWLKGRVVLIGASFKGSRDIYATPLGPMPGTMVIANAIQSLHAHGQIETSATAMIFLIELGVIILMGIAFARLDSALGMLASSFAIIIVMLGLSFWLFKYGVWVFKHGVWLDLAIPLIAMCIHKTSVSIKELRAFRTHNDITQS